VANYQLGDDIPQIPASAYVAAEATIIGKIMIGENTSVWPSAVLRGDNEPITVGAGSNIQDGAVLHADPGFTLNIGAPTSPLATKRCCTAAPSARVR
jgi:carbonic anhydrase/acetyltransferase-like protein (isoleucine patch superfamily)